jgi:hypothetical protein
MSGWCGLWAASSIGGRIILFGLTTVFLLSMTQEVWMAGRDERRRRH